MKISIISFHRSLNYGAFLQVYALQEFLKKHGNDVEIIDITRYCDFIGKKWRKIPVAGRLLDWYFTKIYQLKQYFFYDAKPIGYYLKLSRRYNSIEELKNDPPISDIYICGSDQIWNPDLIINKQFYDFTDAYFLAFGAVSTKRIAYAASFGKTVLHDVFMKKITSNLCNFSWIGVREEIMTNILNRHHIKSQWVCDPTLLHDMQFYNKLINNNASNRKRVFCYSIRTKITELTKQTVADKGFEFYKIDLEKTIFLPSIFKWLALIANSGFIITDSFHCIVFCLIFNKPFAAIAAKQTHSGMNNRLESLLSVVGLRNRIITDSGNNVTALNAIFEQDINWDSVNKNIEMFRINSSELLQSACNTGSKHHTETELT